MVFIDTALSYDPVRRRCDLVFDGTDFVLDATPVTPVLLCVGLDRRARTDDELPDTSSQGYSPATLNAKRGWWGDAYDPLGRLVGSWMWLLVRRKQTEATRLLAENGLQAPLEQLANDRNWPISILVRWLAAGVLGYRVTVGQVVLNLNTPVAG
jgi:phage gp46-like protein